VPPASVRKGESYSVGGKDPTNSTAWARVHLMRQAHPEGRRLMAVLMGIL
jgi:hypothetical protein